MDTTQNNVWKWIVGIIVVLVIGFGIWWFATGNSSQFMAGENATTTPDAELAGASTVTIESSSSSVASIIANVSNGGTFYSLLLNTVGTSSISGKGPYTIFVATDGAFSRLPKGTISAMSSAQLKRLVQYHIVAGKELDVDAISNGQIQALSKDTLNFEVDATTKAVYVNSGYVLHAYKASNGIVYVINSVLVPPQPAPTTH